MKVLYVVHNHPTLHPGGAEAYALELYEAMRETPGVDPVLLARIGSNVARNRVATQAPRSARSTAIPISTSSSPRRTISTSSP